MNSRQPPTNALLLSTAVAAAQAGSAHASHERARNQEANLIATHDVKLKLDVECQQVITRTILAAFPDHAVLGEEDVAHATPPADAYEWIIDPIDGTVNFFYNIPHFAVSIALRQAGQILVGVIYDPMRDEMWSVKHGSPALLNGQPISVSPRPSLSEATISVGVSKNLDTINRGMPLFEKMVRNAKKCRMMGSASLDIAYVACGRLDAYIENMISLWDVAAGILLVETAGGRVEMQPHATLPEKYSIVASSGKIDLGLE